LVEGDCFTGEGTAENLVTETGDPREGRGGEGSPFEEFENACPCLVPGLPGVKGEEEGEEEAERPDVDSTSDGDARLIGIDRDGMAGENRVIGEGSD